MPFTKSNSEFEWLRRNRECEGVANNFRNVVAQANSRGLQAKPIQGFLSGIQGNIIEPHGRGYAVHVVITFKPGKIRDALGWLEKFEPTSAWMEAEEPRPKVFKMLALTKLGYQALGIAPDFQPQNAAFQRGIEGWYGGVNPSYGPGGPVADNPLASIHALAILASHEEADLENDGWKRFLSGFVGTEHETAFCTYHSERGNRIWTAENRRHDYGRKPDGGSDHSYYIEHFGFHDGISNPLFLEKRPPELSKGDQCLEAKHGSWNPFAPLSLALSEEPPFLEAIANPYGSYLAYFKLEQDVPGFLQRCRLLALQFAVDDTAEALGQALKDLPTTEAVKAQWQDRPQFYDFIDDFDHQLDYWNNLNIWENPRSRSGFASEYADDLKKNPAFKRTVLETIPPDAVAIERASAMVVGRYRNGTPVFLDRSTLSKMVDPSDCGDANNFDYIEADPDARTCPFQAHTRSTNSRGELSQRPPRIAAVPDPRATSAKVERSYRIVRRGIPYGLVDDKLMDERHTYVEGDVGNYVPVVTSAGERGLHFVSFQSDLDQFETIADVPNGGRFFGPGMIASAWPRPPDGQKTTKFQFASYVRLMGGAYLFAPSRQYLETIRSFSTVAPVS